MRGFVVEAAVHVASKDDLLVAGHDYHPVIFAHNREDAVTWAAKNICSTKATARILPGVAAPKNFFSGEFEIARTH